MLSEFPIEQEQIPQFRAALGSVADALPEGLVQFGEIVFLDTKVFGDDYLTFCDDFAANDFYPDVARAEMRRRRAAIQSHLGMPLLHGGLSHGGFALNVFVDKASWVVVHWELRREPV